MRGENEIVHENGAYWVLCEPRRQRYTVFISGTTHSTSDSAYPYTSDGLSLATARANYLAKHRPNPNKTFHHNRR